MTALLDEIRVEGMLPAKGADASQVENALNHFAWDVSPEEVVAFKALYGTNGKSGTLWTERAFYQKIFGASSVCFFDGLQSVFQGKSDYLFLFYENGYVAETPVVIDNSCSGKSLELIRGSIRIYRELRQEIEERRGHKVGLSAIAGWEEFLAHRGQGSLDVCRNSVFVSSTFKDMHFERDVIHDRVLPKLNQAGETYGQTVSFCDLRWGVNTGDLDSDEGSRKVLSVCLNEIERCRPYMVVVLGERYGWIPDSSVIENALEGRPDFTLDELEKSVTALEIEFGALDKQAQLDRTFFYFREIEGEPSDIYRSEDALHAEKLVKLKKRIEKLAGGRIRTYRLSWEKGADHPDGLEAFAELVTADLLLPMKEEWEAGAAKSGWEREWETHWELAEKKALQCNGRDSFILSLLEAINRGESRIAVTGAPGSGKSTVMGCLAQVLRISGMETLPIFCGYTSLCDTALEIAEVFARFLEKRLPGEALPETAKWEEPMDWVERMKRAAARYEKEGEKCVVLVLDAVDQLAPDALRKSLKFLPESKSGKICVVFSCVEDLELSYVPCRMKLPPIRREDCPDVIRGILRLHRRELENPVLEAVAEKPASDHPLYLSILIQRLLLMNKNDFDEIARQGDGMSAISRRQMELITAASDTLSGVSRELLEAASERLGGGFVQEAMKYLAVSRRGLREPDLEGLLGEQDFSWDALDFSLFINYLRSMFTLREDGRYDFSHRSFREGLMEILEKEEIRLYHGRISRWLYRLPASDEVRRQELFFHCLEAGDVELLNAILEEEERSDKERGILARELVSQSRRDGGDLLCRLISEKEKNGFHSGFFQFVLYDWHRKLDNSREDSILEERVLRVLLPGAKELKRSKNLEDQRLLGVIYSRLAECFRVREEWKEAFFCLEAALTESEALERGTPCARHKQDVSIDLRQMGQTLVKLGGEENLKRAESCYLKSIEMAKKAEQELPSGENKKCVGWGYRRLAELLEEEKRTEEAARAYECCLEAWKDPVSEREKRWLANVCRDIGYFYHLQEDKEECRKALVYFDKAERIWEELVRENPSVSNLEGQALNWIDIGQTCFFDQEESFRERGIDSYEKGRGVLKNTNPICYRASIARADVRMGKMLWEKNQEEDLSSVQTRCEELAGEAVELYESLAREEDSAAIYKELALALLYCVSWTKNPSKKVSCTQRRVEIYEMLYDKTHEKDYRKSARETKRMVKLYQTFL